MSGEKRAGEERAGAGLAGMKDAMERVNRIWFHPFYQECLRKIRAHEAEREFCRHTPEHFLDVARLTYILALEADCLPSQPLERAAVRERVYAAGLLHDIGRWRQYEEGIPHEQASAEAAEGILSDCSFSGEEQEAVLSLIRNHRTKQEGTSLEALFYRADKLSRSCFSCPAREKCDWSEEKKNLEIRL